MELNFWESILFSFSCIILGTTLGIIVNNLSSQKNNSPWIWIFYSLGGLFLLTTFLFFVIPDLQNILSLFIKIAMTISGLFIIIVTYKILYKRRIYKVSQLDPIINNFSSKADRDEIKLFGGDLSFLGKTVNEIKSNKQYTKLLSLDFKKILILSEQPNSRTQKMRYGLLFSELKNCEIRFYNPDNADLKVRGRIIKMTGINKLLMYTKIDSDTYMAIETDTAESYGSLYNNIWNLTWSLAIKPNNGNVTELKSIYEQDNK